MKRIMLFLLLVILTAVAASVALAEDATVNAGTGDIEVSGNQITVGVALPSSVVGKRIDRATLEVPINVGASADSAFIDFPLVELLQSGSEVPKQTTLLARAFSGIARFDVTRFVVDWSTTDAHQFVLGALSDANHTAVELGSVGEWDSGVKARLVVRYSDLNGTSARSSSK